MGSTTESATANRNRWTLIPLVLGALACGAVLPAMAAMYTPHQMANSFVPLAITLGIPFLLSFIVSAGRPKTSKAVACWIVLASAAFLGGDLNTILTDKGDNHTLWPIELVVLTGLGAAAMAAGVAVARPLRHLFVRSL